MTLLTRRTGLLAMGAVALGACASPTMNLNPDITPIAFEGGTFPLQVNVIRLSIPVRLPPAGSVPVDADGGARQANWIIDDASAVSRQTEQGEAIFGTLQTRLVIVDAAGREEASAGARVDSEMRITGAPSIVRRQELLHGMLIEMAAELDLQMGASIARSLPRYVGPPAAF